MNQIFKDILLFIALTSLGITCGAVIFVSIFEDKFMGLFMGFLIGAGLWFAVREDKKRKEKK